VKPLRAQYHTTFRASPCTRESHIADSTCAAVMTSDRHDTVEMACHSSSITGLIFGGIPTDRIRSYDAAATIQSVAYPPGRTSGIGTCGVGSSVMRVSHPAP
jgi:hypothetical protein